MSHFYKSRRCEWIFILFMFCCLVSIGVFTVVTLVRGREAENEELETKGELMVVQFIFRHGARTPTYLQDDDPYKNYSWSEGLGGLTVHGKERMFQYGQELRKRYHRYVGKC